MALRTIAEMNKSPLTSTYKGLVVIPFRFLTAASSATNVVIGGPGPTANQSTATVTWSSSTQYVINIPGIRYAKSANGTGSVANFLPWCYSTSATGTAQFINGTIFNSGPNGTCNITIGFNSAPPNGTEVRGYIMAQAINVK